MIGTAVDQNVAARFKRSVADSGGGKATSKASVPVSSMAATARSGCLRCEAGDVEMPLSTEKAPAVYPAQKVAAKTAVRFIVVVKYMIDGKVEKNSDGLCALLLLPLK